MAKKIELSGEARRILRDTANNKGWVPGYADELAVAELERAELVYDGAITSDGNERNRQS
jgi:hypothetical protein